LTLSAQGLVNTEGDAEFTFSTDTSLATVKLTDAVQYSYGAVFINSAQNLDEFIEYEFDIMFGDDDDGADGIMFMLQNDPRGYQAHGDVGMGLGYANSPNSSDHINGTSSYVSNSIGIEFDTYRNSDKNDSNSDHIALVYNGNNNHDDYPSSYTRSLSNIEDGAFHRFKFSWNPINNRVKVYFDDVLKIDVNLNIRTIIGSSNAYIGFSATTGARVNQQFVKDVASPLPISLTSFEGKYNPDQKNIDILWSTASETNNDYFTIERSLNGLDFEAISIIDGAGNSNSTLNYEYTDFDATATVTYYRLRQTDYDGQTSVSDIVSVQADESGLSPQISGVNSQNGEILLSVYIPKEQNIGIEIVDLSGKVIVSDQKMLYEGMHTLNYNSGSDIGGNIIFIRILNEFSGSVNKKVFVNT
jgi:hypothetical protein